MAHQYQVVVKVHGVVLRERPSRTQQIHDLHGQGVLHFVFARNRNVPCGQERCAKNDRAHGVFIDGDARALVVVGHQIKIVTFDEGVKSDRRPRRPAQFIVRAVRLHIEGRFKSLYASVNVILTDTSAQGAELIHFEQLHMSAEGN